MKFNLSILALFALSLVGCPGSNQSTPANQNSAGTGTEGQEVRPEKGPDLPPASIKVLQVSPNQGSIEGDTLISIRGEHFTSDLTIEISGVPCGFAHLVSPQTLICITSQMPPQFEGQSVTLTVGKNDRAAELGNAFFLSGTPNRYKISALSSQNDFGGANLRTDEEIRAAEQVIDLRMRKGPRFHMGVDIFQVVEGLNVARPIVRNTSNSIKALEDKMRAYLNQPSVQAVPFKRMLEHFDHVFPGGNARSKYSGASSDPFYLDPKQLVDYSNTVDGFPRKLGLKPTREDARVVQLQEEIDDLGGFNAAPQKLLFRMEWALAAQYDAKVAQLMVRLEKAEADNDRLSAQDLDFALRQEMKRIERAGGNPGGGKASPKWDYSDDHAISVARKGIATAVNYASTGQGDPKFSTGNVSTGWALELAYGLKRVIMELESPDPEKIKKAVIVLASVGQHCGPGNNQGTALLNQMFFSKVEEAGAKNAFSTGVIPVRDMILEMLDSYREEIFAGAILFDQDDQVAHTRNYFKRKVFSELALLPPPADDDEDKNAYKKAITSKQLIDNFFSGKLGNKNSNDPEARRSHQGYTPENIARKLVELVKGSKLEARVVKDWAKLISDKKAIRWLRANHANAISVLKAVAMYEEGETHESDVKAIIDLGLLPTAKDLMLGSVIDRSVGEIRLSAEGYRRLLLENTILQ